LEQAMTNGHHRRMRGKEGFRLIANPEGAGEAALAISAAKAAALSQELTDELRLVFRRAQVNPDLMYAFTKTGLLVTEDNCDRLSPAQMREWKGTLRAYRRRAGADSRAIELCYSLYHERGRSDLSVKRRFAASELGVAVLNALDEEVSSFAMEGAFLNAWLTYCFRRMRLPTGEAERLRRKLGSEMTEILALLEQNCDDLPSPTRSAAFDKRVARIEATRAAPETWLGRPPTSKGEAEWEVGPAFEHLQTAISFCNAAQVPNDVMEAMFFRFWFRTRVINDHMPEVFFQTLDEHWDQVHARVQSYMARYSGPTIQ
jgi:hypothetical protein